MPVPWARHGQGWCPARPAVRIVAPGRPFQRRAATFLPLWAKCGHWRAVCECPLLRSDGGCRTVPGHHRTIELRTAPLEMAGFSFQVQKVQPWGSFYIEKKSVIKHKYHQPMLGYRVLKSDFYYSIKSMTFNQNSGHLGST